MTKITAFIALGSNIGNPRQQLNTAIKSIAKIAETQLIKTSCFYLTAPVGFLDQPDFINAVVELKTTLSAAALMTALHNIESRQHRQRQQPNGPRTLDIDLLLYGQQIITTPTLTVPHPRMKERMFVIYPLVEIAPALQLPCGTPVIDLLIQDSGVQMLPV